jgi:hypothetical protein
MKTLAVIAIALLVVLIVAALAYADEAHDLHMKQMHGTPTRDNFFRNLKQPDSGISCCQLEDCWPTTQKMNPDGTYRALVRGQWKDIPPQKVVKSPASIDGQAYVCASMVGDPKFTTIYCYLPEVPQY